MKVNNLKYISHLSNIHDSTKLQVFQNKHVNKIQKEDSKREKQFKTNCACGLWTVNSKMKNQPVVC